MEQRGYIANGDKVADLISYQIYNLVSAIVEEVANFYDEGATEVKLEFKEEEINDDIYITEIRISGDGNGFTLDSLKKINELVNSEKKENLYTRKFGRIKLGSYGIAFVSLRLLGNKIEIYSRPNKNEETLYRNITIENNTTVFSEIEAIRKCSEVNYDTGCTLVIKGCKILKSNFSYNDLLKSKLSYLPISDNFRIYLYNEEIKRFFPDPDSFNMKFNFNIDKFEFNAEIFYEPKVISNKSYRGVFLEVDGRIIDWNIYNAIRHSISSPGIVDYRINGYIRIENNEFRNKINASRNKLNDYNLAMNIENILRKNISSIIEEFTCRKLSPIFIAINFIC